MFFHQRTRTKITSFFTCLFYFTNCMNNKNSLQTFRVWKCHHMLLHVFGREFTTPLQSARIIFLFTSVAYNIQGFFYPIPLIDEFPDPSSVRLRLATEYEILLKLTLSHLITQYYKTLTPEPVYVSPTDHPLRAAEALIKQYLDARFADGWNVEDPLFALPNADASIKINAAQNLIAELPQPEKWTPIQNTKPLGANWKNVRGILPEHIRGTVLAKFYNDVYPNTAKIPLRDRAKQILDVSESLTDEQKMCAELWEGSVLTPPAINYALLTCLFAASNTPLAKACKIYLMLGIGLFEASIVTWDIKYKIMEPRPIQTVRMYFPQVSTSTHYGSSKGKFWCPYQKIPTMTPPFPDTTSGHSCFSAVSAAIIAHFFGKRIPKNIRILSDLLPLISPILLHNQQRNTPTFLDRVPVHKNASHICNICPRKDVLFLFQTWSDLANHAGMSRIYGGIHYHTSNTDSLYVGKLLSREIIAHFTQTLCRGHM